MTGASAPGRDELMARAAWSRLTEPGDPVAGALVSALGAVDALAWLREHRQGDGVPAALLPADVAPALVTGRARARLHAAAQRWGLRLDGLDAARDVGELERRGGTVVVPGDSAWPPGLDDLGDTAPHCLWVRGDSDVAGLVRSSVAVIGARACTSYGEHVTAQMAAGLVDAGVAVVSGGAYGIDAVAHRGALAAQGTTVAFLAGGVDRAYPAGNVRVFGAIVEAGGALVSEVPPGAVPTKSRFLQRNRLIAAASRGTVVVEAAWRSGALNTAGTAARLLRPVGAVPGPVTSAASAGCHRLLREGVATVVTGAAEVVELVTASGQALPRDPVTEARVWDGLDEVRRRTLDALPLRRSLPVPRIARSAGLTVEEVRAALGLLELDGLAVHEAGQWRRT